MSVPLYDKIGLSYSATRQEEPRIAQLIWSALGDATSVANIGAGTGNYEPRDRQVIAVEPSEVMIAQRPAGAAPVVRGRAEQIPLEDKSVDAALAVLTDQHWDDCRQGLAEMKRIARRRVVALTLEVDAGRQFWLTRDYLREARAVSSGSADTLVGLAAEASELAPVPVPWDCRDGFYLAYWRRPRAYLDPAVRAGISVFHHLEPEYLAEAMQHLAYDLATGIWRERYGDLLDLEAIDLGLRLVVWSLSPGRAT